MHESRDLLPNVHIKNRYFILSQAEKKIHTNIRKKNNKESYLCYLLKINIKQRNISLQNKMTASNYS